MTPRKNSVSRAQSAMEYLMTYGWAILIIAVVLAALFSLNVFNAGATIGTSCIGQPGYSCSSPSITSGGELTFTLGQGSGSTLYNVMFACLASAASNSPSAIPYNSILLSGTPVLSAATLGPAFTGAPISANIVNAQQITISGVQCYQPNGSPTLVGGVGTTFTGAIWMVYNPTSGTTLDGPPNGQFVKVATVAVKASS